METVYDHNPTKKEIDALDLDSDVMKKSRKDGFLSQDSEYSFIASLYHLRKNKDKMNEYIEKISDPDYRHSIRYANYHYSDDSYRI
jgi:hypothetical protein